MKKRRLNPWFHFINTQHNPTAAYTLEARLRTWLKSERNIPSCQQCPWVLLVNIAHFFSFSLCKLNRNLTHTPKSKIQQLLHRPFGPRSRAAEPQCLELSDQPNTKEKSHTSQHTNNSLFSFLPTAKSLWNSSVLPICQVTEVESTRLENYAH
jgi:hypothetical protein